MRLNAWLADVSVDPVNVTDHLVRASDRWLFLFALVMLAMVVLLVGRYFVRQYERLQVEHQRVLADLMGRQEQRQEELVRVVAANTEALRGVAVELRWCKERNLAAGGVMGRETN
jgi:hypothetical protein